MSILKYPILQSGFTALNEIGLVRPKNEPPTFSETILFVRTNKEYMPYFYSEDVTKLFNEFRGNAMIIRTFEFKEKILRAALANFGPSIADWMRTQSRKPSFSYTHLQFLEKILPWTIDLNLVLPTDVAEPLRWIGIIGPGSGHNEQFSVDAVMLDRFANDQSINMTTKALRNWVAREGGYESLLNFLFVIFGERTNHMQNPPASAS